jgi:hypothetical protein
LACPSHVHAPPTDNSECRPPQVSETLFLYPNPGTGHTTAGRTPTTTVRRRPGIRSEAEHFAGRQPGVGFPLRSFCPCRLETIASVCGSAMWASPKAGDSEHTIPAKGTRFTIARSHMDSSGETAGGCRVRFVSQSTRSRCRRSLHVTKRGSTPLVSTFLAVEPPHARSCLAPGERGEHAAPTTSRRQDPLPPVRVLPSHPYRLGTGPGRGGRDGKG